MSNTFVSYNHFKIGNFYVKPPQYYLTRELMSRLIKMQNSLEEKEKARFKEMFGYKRASKNWKEDFKNFLGQGYRNYKESAAFKSMSSAWDIIIDGIEDYNTKKEKAEMQQKFVDRLALDLEVMNNQMAYSLFPTDKEEVQKVGGIIFNTLYTLYKGKKVKVTKTGLQFKKSSKNRNFIAGYLFEMFNGVLGNAAHSTSRGDEQYLSDVADYYIEGVGFEEIKRSALYGPDMLKDISFHLGQFNSGGILSKGTGGSRLKQRLGNAILNIINRISYSASEEEIRDVILHSFTEMVLDYLEWRIYDMPNTDVEKYQGIFWFVTKHGVILGSEFIQGIIDYNKLYISGNAEFVTRGSEIDYRTEGFKYFYQLLLSIAGDIDTPLKQSEQQQVIKELINDTVEKNTSSLIKKLQFSLNYGNYGNER